MTQPDISPEAQAAAILSFLDQTFTNSPLGVCFLDTSHVIRWANRTFARQNRVDVNTLPGRPIAEVAPSWTIQISSIYEHVRESGIGFSASAHPFVFREQPERGTTYWNINITPLRSPTGEFRGWLQIQDEVTKQVHTEEALKKSEAKYRIVADNTYDWEFWVDQSGEFVYSSPSCERVTGYTPQEFAADKNLLQRIIHPDDLPKYISHTVTADEPPLDTDLVFRVLRRDGGTAWISHMCQPVYDEEGRFAGRRGSNRDISERVRIEEVRQTSQERLIGLAESSVVGIMTTDREKILAVNEAFLRITGYAEEEVEGGRVRWRDITPRELRFLGDRAMEELEIVGHCAPFETEFIRRDGCRIPVLMGAALIDRSPVKLACFLVDLSEMSKDY
jgi:PAS domain S-box-containing protein